MARVSSTVTPDLLLTDRYNQQNMYNIKDVDPGGGEEEFEEDSRNEFDPDWRSNFGILNTNSVINSSMSNGHPSAAIYPSRCPHCRNWIGNSVTLEEKMIHTQHILSGCKKFQNQGRYNWRHDAVLNYIDSCMDRDELRVFCDLAGRRTDSEGTVPEELLSTEELLSITPSNRSSSVNSQVLTPNIMFLSRSFSKDEVFVVGVVEITIPWDGRVEAARAEKRQTYSPLVEALSARTRTPVRFISIEIGCFNQRLSESSRMAVRELYAFTKQEVSLRVFRARLLKLAELASFHIFTRRNDSDWDPPSNDNYNITNKHLKGTSFNRSESSLSSMSFLDVPEYLELPESLLIACNEDEKDNVSSESGGGASSGGSLGSISNTCATTATSIVPPASYDSSYDSMLSSIASDKTVFEKPVEYVNNHHNYDKPKSDIIENSIKTDLFCDTTDTIKSIELNSGKEDTKEVQTTDPKPSSPPNDQLQKDPVSFGWKTQAVIYGSVFSAIGYFIYTYWHIILLSLVALFFYELWDLYSARKRKSEETKSD